MHTVLTRMESDEGVRTYVFRRLGEKPDPRWFVPLKDRGYFAPDKAPGPVPAEREGYFTVPGWEVLPYLIGLSKLTEKPEWRVLVPNLLEVVKSVASYEMDSGTSMGNFHTWTSFVQILSNLPSELIPQDVTEFIPGWVATPIGGSHVGVQVIELLLPKLLRGGTADAAKAEAAFMGVTPFRWRDIPESERLLFRKRCRVPQTFVEPYFLTEDLIAEGLAKDMGRLSSGKPTDTVIRWLKEILDDIAQANIVSEDVSSVWLPSLGDSPDVDKQDAVVIYAFIARDLLLGEAAAAPARLGDRIGELLSDGYPYAIFKRLAFYVADKHWDVSRQAFESAASGIDKWLWVPSCEAELGQLLHNHVADLKPGLKDTFVRAVERGPGPTATGEPFDAALVLSWKQKWLSYVKSDPYFEPFYREYREMTGREESHEPPFRVEVRSGPGPSPRTANELLKMPGADLAELLLSFRTQDYWVGPTAEGLWGAVVQAVREEPTTFADKLPALVRCSYRTLCDIIRGYSEVWPVGKDFDWGAVLQFASSCIKQPDFGQDARVAGQDPFKMNHRTFIGEVAVLLQRGTEKDKRAFGAEHVGQAESLLLAMFPYAPPPSAEQWEDPLTHALNSTWGKLLMALIFLALRRGRLRDSGTLVRIAKWPQRYRLIYDRALNKGVAEAYTLFGRLLVNLDYLDSAWTQRHIAGFAELPDTPSWQSFMYGYLFQADVRQGLYDAMRPHYKRALNFEFKWDHPKRGVVEHICIGYLRGYDDVGGRSLMDELVRRWDADQLEAAAVFFWQGRKYFLGEEQDEGGLKLAERQRILVHIRSFWKTVVDKCREKATSGLSDVDRRIASALSALPVFLSELSEDAYKRWMFCVEQLRPGSDATHTLEALARLAGKNAAEPDERGSAEYAGQLFKHMLTVAKLTPDFDKAHITTIVDRLDALGGTAAVLAEEIRETYVERGIYFLRPKNTTTQA